MRTYSIFKFGDRPSINELPIPDCDTDYLVRITYAGVNPVDYKSVSRLTESSTFPYILGADFAGVVERVPVGGGDFHVGDRVFGMARTHGAYAEFTSVPIDGQGEPIAKIPDGVSDQQAAALPIPAITALGAIDWLEISPGSTAIVFGAAGAVGSFAVEIARSRGAHVIAIVRGRPGDYEYLGAEELYSSDDAGFVESIRDSHPDGADAILDIVNGPEDIRKDIEIVKEGGRLVSTIYAADTAWFNRHKISAFNIAGQTNPRATREGLDEAVRLTADGAITVRIRSVDDLDQAGEVLDRLKQGGLHGKSLIRL